MTVKVEVQTLDPVRRRLSIEVPASEVDAAFENEYSRISRVAKVPGFRPGRAPRHVLRQLYGDRVQADIFEQLIQKSLVQAVEQEGIEPVGRPEVVTEKARPGDALLYSATLEVKPDIVVKDYTGVEVERPIRAVSDADVDLSLERLREASAQLQPVTDREEVAHNDVVRLDYEARLGGKVVGRGEGRDIQVGANGFPPEFDRQLIGAAVGSDLAFEVAYPEDESAGALAGKSVDFTVKVQGLSTKSLPALDDEFAKDQGDCATLAELRERIRKQLEHQARAEGDDRMRHDLLGKIIASNDLVVPHAMVERRLHAMMEETQQDWQRMGRWPREDTELRKHLHREFHPQADYEVKAALLLEAIARQEGIAIADAEVEDRIEALAAQADQAAERVRAYYGAPEAKQALRARMLQSRAMEAIVKHAEIRDVEKSSVADPVETG